MPRKIKYEKRLDTALAEEKKVWDKAKIRKEILVIVPGSGKVPLLARIGMWLIERYNVTIRTVYHDMEGVENSQKKL